MKIYFAGSITSGRHDVELYSKLVQHLKKYGEVLTEHVGDPSLSDRGEEELEDTFIHDRDMKLLKSADVIVAEVSTPSLGVGYELGNAVNFGIPILCLYRPQEKKVLSNIIEGSGKMTTKYYNTVEEALAIIDGFIENLL